MVEYLHPGVYVTEIPSQVRPIEGVATSTAHATPPLAAIGHVRLPHDGTPAWTDHNDSDPGVTLLQLFAWLCESMRFAAPLHPAGRPADVPVRRGVVQGLAVEGQDTGRAGELRMSPGMALTAHGRPIEPESTTVAVRRKKP